MSNYNREKYVNNIIVRAKNIYNTLISRKIINAEGEKALGRWNHGGFDVTLMISTLYNMILIPVELYSIKNYFFSEEDKNALEEFLTNIKIISFDHITPSNFLIQMRNSLAHYNIITCPLNPRSTTANRITSVKFYNYDFCTDCDIHRINFACEIDLNQIDELINILSNIDYTSSAEKSKIKDLDCINMKIDNLLNERR